MLVLDSLTMLVTSDPVTEIDAALATTVARLQDARGADDHTDHTDFIEDTLAIWIDVRLDERLTFDPSYRQAGTESQVRSSKPVGPVRSTRGAGDV